MLEERDQYFTRLTGVIEAMVQVLRAHTHARTRTHARARARAHTHTHTPYLGKGPGLPLELQPERLHVIPARDKWSK